MISILLLEDDEIDIMNVQRAFKKTGFEHYIHVARNGEEGLALLHAGEWTESAPTPEVVLLDVNMPKMNGFEFLDALRLDTIFSLLSVYMLTTSSSSMDVVRAYERSVCGYVVKPMDFDQFTEAIHTLCEYWSVVERP